jgi:hypothetical protein
VGQKGGPAECGQVAQIEKQIPRATIFPVQNPNLAPVINQVPRQQIVMAMADTIGDPSGFLDPYQDFQGATDMFRKGDLSSATLEVTTANCSKRAKRPRGALRRIVIPAQRLDQASQNSRPLNIIRLQNPPFHEPGYQGAFIWKKSQHLRAHARIMSCLQAGIFGSAVNPKQARVVPHDPQDEPLSLTINAIIAIG